MTWRTCRLGDVVTLKRGHDLPADRRVDGEVPVVSSSGITGCHNEAKAQAPGVVTGRYGTIGEVFYVEQDYWPLNTALYVIDFKNTHPRFAAYFLRNVLRDYQSDKAAVPGVDRNVLHELMVRVPNPKTQEAIVDVLVPYDDLIENNVRRIGLLERAARMLYEEWFVRLRFPGREHTRITNSTIGPVPDNWEVLTLRDICSRVGDGAHHSPPSVDDGYPMASMKDMDDWGLNLDTCRRISESDYAALVRSNYRPEVGDVLVAKDGANFLKYALVVERSIDLVLLSSIALLRPNARIVPYFLRFALQEPTNKGRLASCVSGVAIPRIIVKDFARFTLVVPPRKLLDEWWDSTQHAIRQIHVLRELNVKLRVARDLLLPRLMSGEISV